MNRPKSLCRLTEGERSANKWAVADALDRLRAEGLLGSEVTFHFPEGGGVGPVDIYASNLTEEQLAVLDHLEA